LTLTATTALAAWVMCAPLTSCRRASEAGSGDGSGDGGRYGRGGDMFAELICGEM